MTSAPDPHMGPPPGAPSLAVAWLGRVGYRAAWELQEALRRHVLENGEETVLLLEHDPVITLGRSADPTNVLLAPAVLRARGIEVVNSSRGGDVTYHGPGQLVAYPIVRLDRGVAAHVEAMAAAVVDVAAAHGVRAAWRRDCPGVWIGARKLCAFGVQVHRRVAIHGLALNVTTSLDAFSAIVPCGLRGRGVTSLAQETRCDLPLAPLARELGAALAPRLRRIPRFLDDDEPLPGGLPRPPVPPCDEGSPPPDAR